MSYRTSASETSGMPTGIPYIIGNEAAERFSFYGMKAVLYVFITQYLHFMGSEVADAYSEYEASDLVYTFNIAVYLTPVIGAIIADLWWGKYKTIIYLSIVYCLGHLALAFMGGFGDADLWLIGGLVLIAVGAGGIKPCVSAHVGDQFGPNNQSKLTKVFNWFYFSINLGAAIAGLLTPFLLHKVGPHFAFGLPGVLMAIATLMFWFGRRSFVHIAPSGNLFVKTVCSKEGLKVLLKLTSIFIFVPIFWALFDQTATTWVHQAQDMNREIWGINISPAQIQALNPFLILILIPIFTYGLYPLISKVFPLTPLRKMSIGFFITAISFGVSAYIQTMIESGETPHIMWQFLAYLLITSAEIMVSIVCLEFAYIQAPKTMKSAIMSIFLVTVALGNFINLGINQLLYAPTPHKREISELKEKKKLDPEAKYLTVQSEEHDAKIIITFTENNTVKHREIPSRVELDQAALKIQDWANANKRLPQTKKGKVIIEGMKDRWGNPIFYKLINGSEGRLRSMGADQKNKTGWDSIITLKYTRPDLAPEEEEKKEWLNKRKEKLGANDGNESNFKNPNQRDNFKLIYTCGGIAKIEGSNHFWLFTGIMFVAALIFIPVSVLFSRSYKPIDEPEEKVSEA